MKLHFDYHPCLCSDDNQSGGSSVGLPVCIVIGLVAEYFHLSSVFDWEMLEQNLAIATLSNFLCLFINSRHSTDSPRGGGGGGDTSYVGRYVMLGYTWVVFEKFLYFSARWVPFFNKISVFFCKVGIYFEVNFCILSSKIEPICKKFSAFYSTNLM